VNECKPLVAGIRAQRTLLVSAVDDIVNALIADVAGDQGDADWGQDETLSVSPVDDIVNALVADIVGDEGDADWGPDK
jgi:hypothetical protein